MDSKWLLHTSDVTLTPDDLAAAYNQLLAVERGWRDLRHELDRMALVTLATPAGHIAQRSLTTLGQKTILAALDLPEPPRYFDFTTT